MRMCIKVLEEEEKEEEEERRKRETKTKKKRMFEYIVSTRVYPHLTY